MNRAGDLSREENRAAERRAMGIREPLASPASRDLLPRDVAERLDVLADSLDRFDLMRAIARCDELVSQLRAVQLMHSQNLCRVANHLASDAGSLADGEPIRCARCEYTDSELAGLQDHVRSYHQ